MKEFQQALEGLSTETAKYLSTVPGKVQEDAREIRLRSGRPVCIVTGNRDVFLDHIIWQGELFECFRALCGYSIHSHEEEIRQGYVTIKGGHRAGLCGTAVYSKGEVINIRSISSINLRIAHPIYGVAEELVRHTGGQLDRLLLVGAPSSGKTTLLRDMVRCMKGKKVVVVDSRGEIAACSNGLPQYDLGNADVLDGWEKADGMMAAIRTMGPDVVVCDEIGDPADSAAVEACLNAGVSVVATAHAGSPDELCRRPHILHMVRMGAFDQIVFLEGKKHPCRIRSIWKAGDLDAYLGRYSD